MRVNLLFKAFSFILMNTLVMAKEQGDCKEIESYFSRNKELYENTIEDCIEKDGKVIELNINKYQELSDEVMNKILSFSSIKTLKYVVKKKDEKFPNLSKLTELENLHFSSGEYVASSAGSHNLFSVYMDNDNFDTISNTLKQLKLTSTYINQRNAKKIVSLENLENLDVSGYFEEDALDYDFIDLSNREKLTDLSMNYKLPKNILKTKSLKRITLTSVILSEKELEELTSLSNIEELYLTDVTGEDYKYIDFDLSILNTLSILYIGYLTPNYPNYAKPYNFNYKYPKSLKELTLTFRNLTTENLNNISALKNLEKLTLTKCTFDDVKDLEALKSLSNLTVLTINFGKLNEIPECVYSLSNLEVLDLSGNSITAIPDNLATLKSLEQIIFINNEISDISKKLSNLPELEKIVLTTNNISDIPEDLYNIPNLKYLDLGSNKVKTISDNVEKLTKLETLKLYGNDLTKFPKNIAKLKNLEILDLSLNDIDDEIPKSYNDLPVLKEIELWDNKNIKGKTLTNESLTKCLYYYNFSDHYNDSEYNELYNICKNVEVFGGACLNENYSNVKYDSLCRGNEKCLQEGDLSDLKPCSESTTSTTTSSNGKCGKENGKCPSGQCCSKYGWCGKTDDYCSASKGCQSEFGKCNEDTSTNTTPTITTSSNGKCGKENGKCPSGQCCSKYGWCGKTDDYCSASKGCQSEFGKCNENNSTTTTIPVSSNDKCGKEYGKCPSDKCCSKYGWCGKTDDHCSVSKGCQSEFGKCNENTSTTTTTSSNGKCGKEDGKCPSGHCCSKHGWCGKTDDYCSVSKGCQSAFGKCN